MTYIYDHAYYLTLPYKEVSKYKNVGMGGLNESNIPIITNGILTCMGIGFTKDNKNYFSHASPIDTTDEWFINQWKYVIQKNNPETIYLYRLYYELDENAMPFFKMLENIDMLDRITIVGLDEFKSGQYTDTVDDYGVKYPNIWDTNFKIGISKDGPFGFVYDICRDLDKEKCLQPIKRQQEDRIKNCFWNDRLGKCEIKRKRWK